MCAQPFVPGNDWTHLAVQGSSLLIAVDCGGQFLTRSHRTALSEQTGPVPRVITISFLSKMPYTVLVSGSATPEVIVMNDSFVCYGEFCQTPMVTPRGLEPRIFGLKGRRVDQFHYGAISLFLRPHLFYSGLSPHATYLISNTTRVRRLTVRVGGS